MAEVLKMKVRISLPNALLVSSTILLALNPSIIVLGLVLITALHANATRLTRFKRQEQQSTHTAASVAQEGRIKTLEAEMQKLSSAVSMTKLTGR